MYRLLIVDDERYLVESIYELISAQSELDLDILTCCYSDEAMQIINSQRIDLILLDINMPGKTGLEIADELAEIWPSCQIIFLTGYADFDYIYRSSKLKNATFLLKTEDNDTILKAVRDAISQLDFETEHRKLLSKRAFQRFICKLSTLPRSFKKIVAWSAYLSFYRNSIVFAKFICI